MGYVLTFRKSNEKKCSKKRNRPSEDTLLETYNLPLKTDDWKTTLVLGWHILRGKLLVSGSATVLNVCFERLLFVLFAGVLISYPKVLRMETGIFTYANLLHQLFSHSCR